MRVITIQRKEVINQLRNFSIYHVSQDAPIPSNLIKPYKFMMSQYKYKYRPIFMCPVGYCVNFSGANTDNTFIIELEIPERFCKIQDYYGWSDFIYFSELPWEYEEFNGCKTVEQFGKYILDMYKGGFTGNKDTVYQVTSQFIRKNWIRRIIPINEKFINRYVDNGGINKLTSII